MSEPELTISEAMTELRELMRFAASGEPPQRFAASAYTVCRDRLVASELRATLPGFLLQCLTISRFRDFIQLYSPSLADRLALIDGAFRACETRSGEKRTFDVFGDDDL